MAGTYIRFREIISELTLSDNNLKSYIEDYINCELAYHESLNDRFYDKVTIINKLKQVKEDLLKDKLTIERFEELLDLLKSPFEYGIYNSHLLVSDSIIYYVNGKFYETKWIESDMFEVGFETFDNDFIDFCSFNLNSKLEEVLEQFKNEMISHKFGFDENGINKFICYGRAEDGDENIITYTDIINEITRIYNTYSRVLITTN